LASVALRTTLFLFIISILRFKWSRKE